MKRKRTEKNERPATGVWLEQSENELSEMDFNEAFRGGEEERRTIHET